MLTNPKDPLSKTSDAQRELFNRLTASASGFTIEHVAGAAANLIVNAVRQANATQKPALDSLDEIFSHVRTLLAGHYDKQGKRRNIFPFHQHIEVPVLDARAKVGNGKAN